MTRFDRGYLRLGAWGGAPIYFHWTTVLGALIFGFVAPAYGNSSWLAPGAWVAFVVVVLAHEVGHAVAVRRFGGVVRALRIWMFGGECEFESYYLTKGQEIAIAWAGVIGQAVLFAVTYFLVRTRPSQETWLFGEQLIAGLLIGNAVVAVFNLLPFGRFDGRVAWKAIPYLFRRLTS